MSNIDLSQLITATAKQATALSAAQTSAAANVVATLDALSNQMTGDVPQAERDSWAEKHAAAIAFIDATASPTQIAMLAAEATVTGETQTDLAGRIIAKANAFTLAIGAMAGLRRKYVEQIETSTTPEEVATAMAAFRAELAAAF